MCLRFEEGDERGRGGFWISVMGVGARVRASAPAWVSLGRLDDGDLRERFVSARRGSGRVSWKFRAGRRAGRAVRVGVLRASGAAVVRWSESQARARRARGEPARRARGERARRARRRRTKPVSDRLRRRGKPLEVWSQVHASQGRPSFGRHARSGRRDILSELVSLASKAGSTKRHGPGDQPPGECAHDARPASAPNAEAPSRSGSGGGIADHDPNGRRTHVRLQGEVPSREAAHCPCFRAACPKTWRETLLAPSRRTADGVRHEHVASAPPPP